MVACESFSSRTNSKTCENSEKSFFLQQKKVRKFQKRSTKLEKLSLENLWKSQNNAHELTEQRSWSLKRNYKKTVEKSRRNLLFFSKVIEFIALLMLFISFNFLTILWFVTHTYPVARKQFEQQTTQPDEKLNSNSKLQKKCAREKKKILDTFLCK